MNRCGAVASAASATIEPNDEPTTAARSKLQMIEQREEIARVVGVGIAREMGSVGGVVGQFVPDAGEATDEPVHDHRERFARVGHSVNEHERRAGTPGEVPHPVAASVEDTAARVCTICG